MNVLVEENSLQAIAEAIREKNGSADTYKPSQMADAVRGIQSGGSIPHLLSITEYTHAEDWTNGSVGNVLNFAKTYCNYDDTSDVDLYVCYIENNNTSLNYNANYMQGIRYSGGYSSINYRNNWSNVATITTESRSFYITKGAKITVARFKVGE